MSGLATINNPWGILFDSGGNMWFSNEQLSVSTCSGSVVEFAVGSFARLGSVTPTPKVVLTQNFVHGVESLCDPHGIAINLPGDLAIANAANGSIAGFFAGQLGESGNPPPLSFIVGAATTLNAPTGLVFGPDIN